MVKPVLDRGMEPLDNDIAVPTGWTWRRAAASERSGFGKEKCGCEGSRHPASVSGD